MPTNLAVFEILPPNFLICEIKYSFSKFSLASLKGIERFSVTEKVSLVDLDRDSLIISIIFSSSLLGERIAILSIKFLILYICAVII